MRTIFTGENAGIPDSRTASAQKLRRNAVKFPLRIRHRKATVTLYGQSERYPYYRVSFYVGTRRTLRSFPTLADARTYAERTVRELADGNEAARLKPEEARDAVEALTQLRRLDLDLAVSPTDSNRPAKITLIQAIHEFAEAKRLLSGGSLVEAARGYLTTLAHLRRVPVSTAVEEYLAQREPRTRARAGERPDLSPRFHYQDGLRLRRFSKAFSIDVCDLTPELLTRYFTDNFADAAPKSRNHHRGSLFSFFDYCVRAKYLRREHELTDAPGMTREKARTADATFFTPQEFKALLTHASLDLLPVAAIGGFAGLRTAELLRLDWSNVWRRPSYIEIPAAKAKTASARLVPIADNLAAWLEPYTERRTGLVWPWGDWKFHADVREALAATGLSREDKDNALRHSFISYRLALVFNEHQVATEAGTSGAMIHKHYRALVTPEEAAAWFAIRPESGRPKVKSATEQESPQ